MIDKKRLLERCAICLVISVGIFFAGLLLKNKYLVIGTGWAMFGELILFFIIWTTILFVELDNKPKEEFKEKPEKKYTLIDITNGNHRIMGHSMTGSDIFTYIHNLNFDSISNDFKTPEKIIVDCYSNNDLIMQFMILKEEEN